MHLPLERGLGEDLGRMGAMRFIELLWCLPQLEQEKRRSRQYAFELKQAKEQSLAIQKQVIQGASHLAYVGKTLSPSWSSRCFRLHFLLCQL